MKPSLIKLLACCHIAVRPKQLILHSSLRGNSQKIGRNHWWSIRRLKQSYFSKHVIEVYCVFSFVARCSKRTAMVSISSAGTPSIGFTSWHTCHTNTCSMRSVSMQALKKKTEKTGTTKDMKCIQVTRITSFWFSFNDHTPSLL